MQDGMTWLGRQVYRVLWPILRFDADYMKSDTLGNYTRYYSWSANQLGHFTLGLGLALAFVWVVDVLGRSLALVAPRAAKHFFNEHPGLSDAPIASDIWAWPPMRSAIPNILSGEGGWFFSFALLLYVAAALLYGWFALRRIRRLTDDTKRLLGSRRGIDQTARKGELANIRDEADVLRDKIADKEDQVEAARRYLKKLRKSTPDDQARIDAQEVFVDDLETHARAMRRARNRMLNNRRRRAVRLFAFWGSPIVFGLGLFLIGAYLWWFIGNDAYRCAFNAFWTEGGGRCGDGGRNTVGVHIFMAAAMIGVTVVAVAGIVWKLAERIASSLSERERSMRQEGRALIFLVLARVLLIVGLIAACWFAYNEFNEALAENLGRRRLLRIEASAVLFVGVLLWSLAALQSRTPIITALSWTAIAAALTMFLEPEALLRLEIVRSAYDDGGADLYNYFAGQAWFLPAAASSVLEATREGSRPEVARAIASLLNIIFGLVFVGLAMVLACTRRPHPRWSWTIIFFALAGTAVIIGFGHLHRLGAPGSDMNALALGGQQAGAALIISLAVWWAKEFGNDLRRVTSELDEADFNRAMNKYPRMHDGVSRKKDFSEAVYEYRRDAIADAVTDSMFYLLGAILALGILTGAFYYEQLQNELAQPGRFYSVLNPLQLPDAGWRNVPAMIGLLAFLAIFIVSGFSWMLRAVAIDDIQVFRAFRFALIGGAMDLRVYHGEQPQPLLYDGRQKRRRKNEHKALGSMQALMAFSRGALHVGPRPEKDADQRPAQTRISHLIVAGRYGSGRKDLANAIASETVLCNLPPWPSELFKRVKGGFEMPRRVRFLLLKNVLDADERQKESLRFRDGKPDMFVLNEADPFALNFFEAFKAVDETAQDVIGDYSVQVTVLDRRGEAVAPSVLRRRILSEVLDKLSVDGADQTVWVVNADVPPATDHDWADMHTPQEVKHFRDDLAACLAERAAIRGEAISDNHIAVALVARRAEETAEA